MSDALSFLCVRLCKLSLKRLFKHSIYILVYVELHSQEIHNWLRVNQSLKKRRIFLFKQKDFYGILFKTIETLVKVYEISEL